MMLSNYFLKIVEIILLIILEVWQWRTGNFEPEVWDKSDGTLSINMDKCDYVGGVVLCQNIGTTIYNNNMVGGGLGKNSFNWIATKL